MKKNKKYITLDDGIDFRKISQIMSAAGYQLNHATARNQLISAIKHLLNQIGNQIGIKFSKKRMKELINSQETHNILADVLYMACQKNEQKGKVSKYGNRIR